MEFQKSRLKKFFGTHFKVNAFLLWILSNKFLSLIKNFPAISPVRQLKRTVGSGLCRHYGRSLFLWRKSKSPRSIHCFATQILKAYSWAHATRPNVFWPKLWPKLWPKPWNERMDTVDGIGFSTSGLPPNPEQKAPESTAPQGFDRSAAAHNPEVAGSSPVSATIKHRISHEIRCFSALFSPK